MSEGALPPVLLLHGFASSFAHGWQQTGWTDLLADAGREVLAVDLPGHGAGGGPADPAAYAHVDEHVAAVMADRTPVDAVGFSMGARILLGLAAADPTRFRKIVVIGVGANLFRDDDYESLARALDSGAGTDDDLRAQLFVRLAGTAGNDPKALAAFLRRPVPRLTAEALARVSVPVLVAIGDQDFAGPGDPLVAALPDARLAVLRHTDHFAAPANFTCISRALSFLDAAPA